MPLLSHSTLFFAFISPSGCTAACTDGDPCQSKLCLEKIISLLNPLFEIRESKAREHLWVSKCPQVLSALWLAHRIWGDALFPQIIFSSGTQVSGRPPGYNVQEILLHAGFQNKIHCCSHFLSFRRNIHIACVYWKSEPVLLDALVL